MYIPATPSPLPLKANPEKPVQVVSFDRDARPTMNAPTTNALQGFTGFPKVQKWWQFGGYLNGNKQVTELCKARV